jgi:hypothetical protein
MTRPLIEKRVNSKESFKKFKKENPQINIEYSLFTNILQSCGKLHSEHTLNGNLLKLPNRMGEICIISKNLVIKNFDGKIVLPIDWKKTKELGKLVYHLNSTTDSYFQVKWYNYKATKGYNFWKFIPNRVEIQRRIKEYMDHTEYYKPI